MDESPYVWLCSKCVKIVFKGEKPAEALGEILTPNYCGRCHGLKPRHLMHRLQRSALPEGWKRDRETIEGTMELVDDPICDLVLRSGPIHFSCGGLFPVERWKGKRVRITIEELD